MENLLYIVVPALLCILTGALVYWGVKQNEKMLLRREFKNKAIEALMPNKIHAYERAILFLERIHPNQLLLRCNPTQKSARSFRTELIEDIRREYWHNLVQQLYISEKSWRELAESKDRSIQLIQEAFRSVSEQSSALDLVKQIMERLEQMEKPLTGVALSLLKQDVARWTS